MFRAKLVAMGLLIAAAFAIIVVLTRTVPVNLFIRRRNAKDESARRIDARVAGQVALVTIRAAVPASDFDEARSRRTRETFFAALRAESRMFVRGMHKVQAFSQELGPGTRVRPKPGPYRRV